MKLFLEGVESMPNLEILLLGVALAIDAGIVTFALSLLHAHLGKKEKLIRGGICAFLFGFFQFLMLWLGSRVGFLFSFSRFGYFYPVSISLIFFLIGFKFFHESSKNEKIELSWNFIPLIFLAILTSLDALASGLSLGVLPQSYLIALDIGVITFFICFLFSGFALLFQNIPDKWLLRFGGVIFLGLGASSLKSVLF
jgi:putative Mn2+ efflux pump MntP